MGGTLIRRCVIGVVAASSASVPLADAPAAPPLVRAAARPAPFVGVVSRPNAAVPTQVGCFDSLSLRPTSAPVGIAEYHGAWSTSPDGRRVALGISAPGRESRIGVQIVDLARGAVEADVETGIVAEAVAWLTDRRVVAGLQGGGIVLVDPAAGRVVRRWRGWEALDAVSTRTRRRFVMLEGGRRTRRLASVDSAGRLRSVSLRLPLPGRLSRRAHPALVADPVREHAYVITGAREVIDVDLRRMRVARRRLRSPLEDGIEHGTTRAWFPWREALWLGGGRLAVGGSDAVAAGGIRTRNYPAGVSVVNTATWSVDVIDTAAMGVALAPGRVIAWGRRGVRGYTRTGRPVFEALRRKTIWNLGGGGRFAYAVGSTATHVIDARSGRIRGTTSGNRELRNYIARRCPGGG
jgi:hypothetical protein